MITWVLIDNKIGGNKQSIAIANKVANGYITKKIKYNFFASIPNAVTGPTLFGVDIKGSDIINKDLPDLIICCGRRLARISLYIKKQNNNKTKIVVILNPNFNYNKFDAVILPRHDLKNGKNVITYIGSLVEIDRKKIDDEVEKWKPIFNAYKKPIVSFFMGGDTKKIKFQAKDIEKIFILKESLLITTSRRTSKESEEFIKNNAGNNYLYLWNREQGANNPYHAMLEFADYLIITGDSINMLAEACSSGKPVYICFPKILNKKHNIFCEELIRDGYAKKFNGKLEKYEYKPLNELDNVAIKLKILLS
ncbi:MAG: mitochondrial fission ELM1 family protein [Rickettsiales bacterium]|jgi:mitochondrial fission protein ELM1|nr:mitochondrial fission ELM1 family protein [Rickettsiales bacterium]